MSKHKKRKNKKRYSEVDEVDSDENFAFIAGYTSGGAPYGVRWEEWEELEGTDSSKNDPPPKIDDKDLPF